MPSKNGVVTKPNLSFTNVKFRASCDGFETNVNSVFRLKGASELKTSSIQFVDEYKSEGLSSVK